MKYFFLIFALIFSVAGHLPSMAGASFNQFEWLSNMERLQAERGDVAKHVHFDAVIESVDTGSGSVTMMHPEMRSGDGSIVMPAMHMTFHVISFSKLKGLASGNAVHIVIGRHKGAFMITSI